MKTLDQHPVSRSGHWLAWVFLLAAAFPLPVLAQNFTQATYRLLEGSNLIDDCPICGRPTLIYSLRGTFDLVLTGSNPLFSTYVVTNIAFTGGPDTNVLTGHGLYTTGGEVAIQQRMNLEIVYNSKPVTFTNEIQFTDKLFPLISIELTQEHPTLLQVLTLKLIAAPAREIWFSTVSSFTPASGGPRGSGGDLISANGQFIQSASNLVAALELPPTAFPVNVDAIDVRPEGEIWYSLAEAYPITSLGPIQHGDLLSNRGQIVKRNQQLTAPFGPMPVVPDVGLDAVAGADDGEIFFSITTDIFGERIGRLLRRGDLLSSRGLIVASNAQLLSRFHPTEAGDVGLDAVYVWPSGEIWFSVEDGFQDKELGPIGPGDLLSSQGVIVHRNLDLLTAFAPIEDLADFGLDALFIVSDVRVVSSGPQITRISRTPSGSRLTQLEWQGEGHVFQVYRSARVDGPYDSVSPILPVLTFEDANATDATGFYRIRQW